MAKKRYKDMDILEKMAHDKKVIERLNRVIIVILGLYVFLMFIAYLDKIVLLLRYVQSYLH